MVQLSMEKIYVQFTLCSDSQRHKYVVRTILVVKFKLDKPWEKNDYTCLNLNLY